MTSDYDDSFPSHQCELDFRKEFGTRVGEDAESWNRSKQFFIAGWMAALKAVGKRMDVV